MDTEKLQLSQIKLNENNPRTITTDKFRKLVDSILVFPKMMGIRPIVVDETMVALGGNMRLQALLEISNLSNDDIANRLNENATFQKKTDGEQQVLLTHWQEWKNEPTAEVVLASNLSEEEKQEFIVKDNVPFGAWDWDTLANMFDETLLCDWGVDTFIDKDFDIDSFFDKENIEEKQAKDAEIIILISEHYIDMVDEIREKVTELTKAYNGVKVK